MPNNIPDFFADDKETEFASNDSVLKEIKEQLDKAEVLKSRIEKGEVLLASLNAELRTITEKIVPELMQSNHVYKIDVDGIGTVTIKKFYSFNIDDEDRPAAYDFLGTVGYQDAVKNVLTIEKSDDSKAALLREKAVELGLNYEELRSVHGSTMKKIIKELSQKGVNIPPYFNVYSGNKAEWK